VSRKHETQPSSPLCEQGKAPHHVSGHEVASRKAHDSSSSTTVRNQWCNGAEPPSHLLLLLSAQYRLPATSTRNPCGNIKPARKTPGQQNRGRPWRARRASIFRGSRVDQAIRLVRHVGGETAELPKHFVGWACRLCVDHEKETQEEKGPRGPCPHLQAVVCAIQPSLA
jgi:hypothetical protein